MPDGDFSRITKVLALPKIINGVAARNSGAIAQTVANGRRRRRRFLSFSSATRVTRNFIRLDEIASPCFPFRRPVAFASQRDDVNSICDILFIEMHSLQFAPPSNYIMFIYLTRAFNRVVINFIDLQVARFS